MAEPKWDFDFHNYLREIDPAYIYQIDRLTGGVVNVTVRASKTALAPTLGAVEQPSGTASLDLSRGRFPGHGTLILKYAPPYIASIGEGAPMSQTRQV